MSHLQGLRTLQDGTDILSRNVGKELPLDFVFLTFEDGTERLSENVSNELPLPLHATLTTQKGADIIEGYLYFQQHDFTNYFQGRFSPGQTTRNTATYFLSQVTGYLNRCNGSCFIGHVAPQAWPPLSPNLTLLYNEVSTAYHGRCCCCCCCNARSKRESTRRVTRAAF
jgi:hypothetical protein